MSDNRGTDLILSKSKTGKSKMSAEQSFMTQFKHLMFPDILPSVEIVSKTDPWLSECWFCQHSFGLQLDLSLRQEDHCPGCVHLFLAGDLTVEYCIPRYNAEITITKGPNPKCPIKKPTENWEKEIREDPHPSWTPFTGYYDRDFKL